MKRKMLIDTDTASDDAVALIMAAKNPDIDVVGITVVSGNVPVEAGVKNALYTLELCNSDIPVYKGIAEPFIQPVRHAYWYHGNDGMGEKYYPDPVRKPEKEHAVDAIIRIIKKYAGDIEIVTLGPLTNIALSIMKAPEIIEMMNRVVMMAGASGVVGNVTPAAEYNVWCDPEAASMVFSSGIKLEMVGWEVALKDAIINEKEIQKYYSINNDLAKFAMDCNIHALRSSSDWLGEAGLIQNDPVAMAIAIEPKLSLRNGMYRVEVELDGKLTRGMTVVDEKHVVGTEEGFTDNWRIEKPNILVHHEIDADGWKKLLYDSLV